jgi:hypothetical protein
MNLIISSIPNDPWEAPFKPMKQAFLDVQPKKYCPEFEGVLYATRRSSPQYCFCHTALDAGFEPAPAMCRVRLHLFLKRQAPTNAFLYELLFKPMDSTRYFEFDFVWQSLHESPVKSILTWHRPDIPCSTAAAY